MGQGKEKEQNETQSADCSPQERIVYLEPRSIRHVERISDLLYLLFPGKRRF